ncbi:heavy metal translocating P-type ATPase [Enterovirga aerilata]|uniref:P-type Zn(2+) transporter n=1 Tax=Enterovirga aerilata TaxID=2730920 RepID=A0A849I9F5_9HYPH|nr:heavy metal translocating P-type ATPase [Enterovirga sp. DB1703]NNM73941.1 heavy metal translocating P-type ATPase [Enterovirga sp. DB1703]
MTINVDPRTLKYRVDGMDCASCASKIEAVVSRFAGAEDISVNFANQVLSFKLDEARTNPTSIEKTIKNLGYGVVPLDRTHSNRAEDEDDGEDRAWWQTRKGRLTLLVAGLAVVGAALHFGAGVSERWAYMPAAGFGLVFFGRRAWAGALAGTPFSIETLVSVATAGALAIGASSEAALVIVLFLVGELLEGLAAGRARAGIRSLADLVPRTALVLDGDATREVPAGKLAVDEVVLVRPGDRVPADGEIVEGASDVDEAPVTGESVPVSKSVGARVFAGSVNTTGSLKLRVTKAAADNTIARIIRLVEEAQAAKSPTARFIDGFSKIYTPFAILFAALVMVLPPLLLGSDWPTWIYRGLALLLVACPCALVLSTPAAIASALAAGARAGLLIKGGAALEAIGHAKTVAFDKTGTLTIGRPKVTDVHALGDVSEARVLELAAAVEARSAHPIAAAILERALADRLSVKPALAARAIAGKAVEGRVGGKVVLVASPRHARELGALPAESPLVETLEREGKTVVVVTLDGAAVGLIAVRDEPRADAAAAVRRLSELGVSSVMLTGDNSRTGEAIGGALGLSVKAELLPDQKLAEIANLKALGGVAMVGDGINDAPALAAANVGIAMGGGTDVALETADAALLRERVGGVVDMVRLSRATLGNIKQNVAIALGLKAVFLVTTITGTTGLWLAILADTGATVLVTLNALRLLRFRPEGGRR